MNDAGVDSDPIDAVRVLVLMGFFCTVVGSPLNPVALICTRNGPGFIDIIHIVGQSDARATRLVDGRIDRIWADTVAGVVTEVKSWSTSVLVADPDAGEV
jgi:hypothetical protein